MIKNFGPAWAGTEDFLKVNNVHFTADEESFMVDVSGLGGDTFAFGVNPEITMTTAYTSDLDIKLGKDDIRVEIFTLLDGEVVDVILPADYEILGEFGDRAEFIDGNTSKLRVFEPLEFNAKVEEAPEAVLRFDNSYEFHRVEPKMFIVKIDENITLSASGSSDAVGEIEKYLWGGLPNNIVVWDEDQEDFVAKSEMDLTEMETIIFQFTNHYNGYHNVTLQVQDSSMKKSNIDWIEFMPDNEAPTIEEYTLVYKDTNENLTMEGDMFTTDEDLIIVFNASSAVDGMGEVKGEIVDWVWIFGDDTASQNGEVVEHYFADPGQYNITLRVVDAVGNEIELLNSTVIKVNDATPPMAVIKAFGDYDIGDPVEMNGTQSYDPRTTGDLKDDIVSWTWYYMTQGQNWTEQTEFGTEPVFNHTFNEPGQYLINLSVVDKAGLEGWVEKGLYISGPDLQVISITFTDPEVDDLRKGERAKISVAYTNAGTVDIDGNWTIRITDNGDKVKEEDITGTIKPGETHYYNFSYKLKEGDERNFVAYVDFGNTISEMSEDNNQIDTTVPVEPSDPIIKWWWFVIILLIVLVAYVVYMKYTRGEWGYEPVQRWWEKRNA
jgi:PKD repeat protein